MMMKINNKAPNATAIASARRCLAENGILATQEVRTIHGAAVGRYLFAGDEQQAQIALDLYSAYTVILADANL